jgi:hypothetical protein
MDSRVSSARARARSPHHVWALALGAAAAIASPALVSARGRAQRNTAATRAVPAPRVTTVSVGWTHGNAERAVIVDALSRAIANEPNLRFAPAGGAVVINTTVRALTIQRDGADALARCELSMVVTDGRGAVQGMLESRRTVRSSSAEQTVAQTALRDALAGAVHQLAGSL